MRAAGRELFPDLPAPLSELRIGWNGIEGRLPSGEGLHARVALLALDAHTFERILPPSPKFERLRPRAGLPLLRQTYIVHWRGLPQPLGSLALAGGSRPLWIERRGADDDHDGISLFWRSDGSDAALQAAAAREAFGRIAPFFDRHVVATTEPAEVPDHERDAGALRVRWGRRILAAKGPLLDLDGPEGAAMTAVALAARVVRLGARKKTHEPA